MLKKHFLIFFFFYKIEYFKFNKYCRKRHSNQTYGLKVMNFQSLIFFKSYSRTRFLHMQEPVPAKFKNHASGKMYGNPVPTYTGTGSYVEKCPIFINSHSGTRFLPTGNQFPRPAESKSAILTALFIPIPSNSYPYEL